MVVMKTPAATAQSEADLTLRTAERAHIEWVLGLTTTQRAAARRLGISRWSLRRRLRKFGIVCGKGS